MNLNHPTLWVFKKEIREIMRDKRVRTGAVITPIFVVMLMVGFFGVLSSSIGKDSQQKIGIVSTKDPILGELQSDHHLKVNIVANREEAEKSIRDGKAGIVVQILTGANGKPVVDMMFDPKEDSSQIGLLAIKQALAPYIAKNLAVVLAQHNVPPDAIDAISFKESKIKVGEGAGAGAMLVGFLPYLMVLFTFTGGFSIASDMVAGEKEKNTLETILITPVHRTQIVLGKFLAVAAVCLTSSLSSVVGLTLTSALKLPGTAQMFGGGFGLTPTTVIAIAFVLLPLAAFFAALLVAVSSYARNVREAQTMLSTVNLIILIPAIFSQVIGYTDFAHQSWVNFVPVLGTALNIREAFQGKTSWLHASESVTVGVILASIAILVAVRLFVREQVLARV